LTEANFAAFARYFLRPLRENFGITNCLTTVKAEAVKTSAFMFIALQRSSIKNSDNHSFYCMALLGTTEPSMISSISYEFSQR
jgi:hypothetical protein